MRILRPPGFQTDHSNGPTAFFSGTIDMRILYAYTNCGLSADRYLAAGTAARAIFDKTVVDRCWLAVARTSGRCATRKATANCWSDFSSIGPTITKNRTRRAGKCGANSIVGP